jgi:hypothetical protein
MARKRKAVTKAATEPPYAPHQLPVVVREGETVDRASARAVLHPSTGAAAATMNFRPAGFDLVPLKDLVEELDAQCKSVVDGSLTRPEAILMAQAVTLDTIFGRLAHQASMFIATPDILDRYLRLALKAQSQSRATLETLAAVKNPPVVYARQANISHGHQQVNNGAQAGTESRPNELLDGH